MKIWNDLSEKTKVERCEYAWVYFLNAKYGEINFLEMREKNTIPKKDLLEPLKEEAKKISEDSGIAYDECLKHVIYEKYHLMVQRSECSDKDWFIEALSQLI